MSWTKPPEATTAGAPGRRRPVEGVRRGSIASLTCGHWLEFLRPHLTEPLFSPHAVGRLRAAASYLPGDSLAILEARLGQGRGRVDLSVRLKEPPQARRLATVPLPSRLHRFLSLWQEGAGPFAPVRSVWLELDLHRGSRKLPPPIPCAKLPRDADSGWLADSLLPALHGKPLGPGQRDLILSCLGAIPAPGYLLYAFSLSPRNGDAIRLEIFGLDPAGILGYLRRVAPWSGAGVREAAGLFTGVERLHLSFDLTSEILPRIGIEGSFPRQPEREPRWAELFSRMVARGLCTAGKRNAVLAWTGSDTFWTAPESWPVEAAGVRGSCLRGLSHVKVVWQPDRELEAKAYLAFGRADRSRTAESA